MNNIIRAALISEKSFTKINDNKYTFIIRPEVSKEEIAEEVTKMFGVTVLSVNTAKHIGKIKRTKKGLGQRATFKKAVVTVKPGQKIDLFEIEEQEDQKAKVKNQNDKEIDKNINT